MIITGPLMSSGKTFLEAIEKKLPVLCQKQGLLVAAENGKSVLHPTETSGWSRRRSELFELLGSIFVLSAQYYHPFNLVSKGASECGVCEGNEQIVEP